MSDKLYEVGQTVHHGDNVLECTEVREVTTHTAEDHSDNSTGGQYSYTFRDQKELDAEREAAEKARTGFEDAPAENEQTDVA